MNEDDNPIAKAFGMMGNAQKMMENTQKLDLAQWITGCSFQFNKTPEVILTRLLKVIKLLKGVKEDGIE